MTTSAANASTALVVLCTFADDDSANAVAQTLVREGLAACVNLSAPIRSIYQWQGTLCVEQEIQATIKTTHERFAALRERLVALHPYDCPEVIALPVVDGHGPYLDWLTESTAEKKRSVERDE